VVVVLVAAVALFGPMVASKLGRGIAESALNDGIAGRFKLDALGLSWSGPQKVGPITLLDPQGGVVATGSASVGAGLLSLATGGMDVGAVVVTFQADIKQVAGVGGKGASTNLAEALRSTKGAPGVPTPGPLTPGGAPAKPAEIRLPKGLTATLTLANSEVKFTGELAPSAGGKGGVQTLGLTNITASGAFTLGAPLKLTATADTLDGKRAVALEVSATDLTRADGLVTLDKAQGELKADANIPGELVDLAARVAMGAGAGPGGAAPGAGATEAARVGADIRLKGGRLTLADASRPAFVEVRVPAALFGAGGAASTLRVENPPKLSLLLDALDFPVAVGSGAAPDYRGASLKAKLRGTETTGKLSLAGQGGGAASEFSIKPFELSVGTRDMSEGLGVIGEIKSQVGGADAGTITVDAVASELLDDKGAIKPGGPGQMRGKLVVEKFSTGVLQPVVDGLGIDLNEVFGPVLKADIRAGVQTAEAPPGGAGAPKASSPYLAGGVLSDKTSLWFNLWIDADRVRSREDGIKIETQAPGYLARRFMPKDAGVSIDGKGLGLLTLTDFEVIGALSGKPDLARSHGEARVAIGDLDVKVTSAPASAGPIRLASVDTHVTFSGDKPLKVKLDDQFQYGGAKFNAVGEMQVTGLLRGDAGAPGGVALNLKEARPKGSLAISNIPTALAALGGEKGLQGARAALGDLLTVKLDAEPGADGSASVKLSIDSAGTKGGGAFVLSQQHVRTEGEGVSLTLNRPAETLNGLLNSAGAGAQVTIDGVEPLTVKLAGLDAALSDSGVRLETIKSKLSVEGKQLGVRLAGPTGGAGSGGAGSGGGAARGGGERVAVDSLRADVVLDGSGGADLTVNAGGGYQASRFSISGTIGSGAVLAPEGVDIRKLSPRGSLSLKDVPTSLLALVDPEQAALVQAVAGPSVDAELSALTDAKGFGLKLTGPGVAVESRAVIAGDRLKVGPTRAQAVITPAAMDAVLAIKAPKLDPRPALKGDAKLALDATEVSLAIAGPTKIDPRPLGQYRIGFRSDNELVVNNAMVLGAGTASARPLNVGVRGLTGNLNANDDPTRVGGEMTAQVKLFNPADPKGDLVTLTVNGGTTLPQQLRELSLDAPDTAAIDRWLGTPELFALALGDHLKVQSMGSTVKQANGTLLQTNIDSPRFVTGITVAMSDGGYRFQPFDAEWTLDPRLADRYVFVDAQGKPTARLARPVKMTLSVESLGLGPVNQLFQPGAFGIDVRLRAPGMSIVTPEGVEADLGDLTARVGTPKGQALGTLNFELATPAVTLAGKGAQGKSQPLSAKGVVEQFADASGNPTPDRAAVTANVTGGLPTPLLDALAGQKGALVDLLGARVDTKIAAAGLSKSAGTLDATLTADNANANAKGSVKAGVFNASEPVVARMNRITPEAGKRYIGSVLPILDKIEKTPDDKPAVITATNLTAPLDGDLKHLNADVVFDLGTVQFKSSDFFGEILKATSNASFGKVGQKIPPFKAKVREGVVEYEKFTLPTGEFELATQGKVDLVKKKMKLTVWVPIFALADELVAKFGAGLPGLKNIANLPLKISGDLDDPDISIDGEQLGKDIVNIPGAAAGGAAGGIEDTLKGIGDLFKKKKKKK